MLKFKKSRSNTYIIRRHTHTHIQNTNEDDQCCVECGVVQFDHNNGDNSKRISVFLCSIHTHTQLSNTRSNKHTNGMSQSKCHIHTYSKNMYATGFSPRVATIVNVVEKTQFRNCNGIFGTIKNDRTDTHTHINEAVQINLGNAEEINGKKRQFYLMNLQARRVIRWTWSENMWITNLVATYLQYPNGIF